MPYPPVLFPLVPKSNAIRRRVTRSIHGGKGCSCLQRRCATHFLSTLVDKLLYRFAIYSKSIGDLYQKY